MNEPMKKAQDVQVLTPERGVAPITPMQMIQIAVERGADIAVLERLMDLKLRYEADEARKAFVSAINAFKANPPKVRKNKAAGFESRRSPGVKTEYEYATLDNVCDVIGGALAEHGLSHRWEVEQDQTNMSIAVTCVITHALGHSERVTLRAFPDDSGSKNKIQAVGSTVTYLERYTLLSACGLATHNMDDDGRAGDTEFISVEQKEELIALIRETDADTVRFLQHMRVESLDTLPADRFNEAVQALQAKKARTK